MNLQHGGGRNRRSGVQLTVVVSAAVVVLLGLATATLVRTD
ncbi:hypothetical protein [Kribbella turkmenica]|nr:hypothetical protein [Kribbella turkmenica]